MKKIFPKPRIFSSKCLGFEACRWNGEIISEKFVERLKAYVEFVAACPEKEIGLGVPRDPIRVVLRDGEFCLMQPSTGRDITLLMRDFAEQYLKGLKDIDGFILKDRSPSCGLKNVKIYSGLENSSSTARGNGFFGRVVMERFPELPVETETRLSNFDIREHFLTSIFTVARFRQLRQNPKVNGLVQFHSENKFLLMAYSQRELRIMGQIAANSDNKKAEDIYNDYSKHLFGALKNLPHPSSNINVLTHLLGFFSKNLKKNEKGFFLDALNEYRLGRVPFAAPSSILKSYIVRFDKDYLSQQTFFEPYPHELMEITDSGKGRELK
ncbi:MAG: DUF523 and DUF1722 domain-containing protein [Candidatus Omnitrophota bacterium]